MVCLDNPSCPVITGRQVIEFSLDPPPLYIRFFLRYFHDEMVCHLSFALSVTVIPVNVILLLLLICPL